MELEDTKFSKTEISIPANAEIPLNKSVAATIFSNKKTNPKNISHKVKNETGVWENITAAEFADEVSEIAAGWLSLGVNKGDRIAIIGKTSYEWHLIDFATICVGAILVPIYDTSSPKQIEWILSDSGAKFCVTEKEQHTKAATSINTELVKKINFLQISPTNSDKSISTNAIKYLKSQGNQDHIDKIPAIVKQIQSTDIASIVYTSGTTGNPKGCVLTHANFLSETRAIEESTFGEIIKKKDSSTLMFLPLAHILARAVTFGAVESGCALGFSSDTKNIVQDFAKFKPTFILSVPRVFEKIYAGLLNKATAEGKTKIFTKAANIAKQYSIRKNLNKPSSFTLKISHFLFDKLVYNKIRNALGGKCGIVICGGAPLNPDLIHFFNGTGIEIYEGYGLTESTAAITVNRPKSWKIGTCGLPVPGNRVQIAADGEILINGDNIFTKYWNNPEQTQKSIESGWFSTGDLGELDEEGYLKITGRKKDILVTAGGKNVCPPILEEQILKSDLISQAVVVGEGKPYVSVLLTIDPAGFELWKTNNSHPEDITISAAIENSLFDTEVQQAIDSANEIVSNAEQIKKFVILTNEFTEENGEITPTLKIKRNVIAEKYSHIIESIYQK